MTTKASIPADAGDATRLLTGQLLVELHLLLSGLVLLLGFLLGLEHVLLGLLLGELGLLVVALLLVLLLFFLLLEKGFGVVVVIGVVVGVCRPTPARRRPARSARSGRAVAAGLRPRTRTAVNAAATASSAATRVDCAFMGRV